MVTFLHYLYNLIFFITIGGEIYKHLAERATKERGLTAMQW